MGCVLRVGGFHEGPDFEVDSFLAASPFKPCAVFHRGEKWHPRQRRADTYSGFNLEVSEAEGEDPGQQVDDAIAFLRENKAEFERLMAFPNLAGACLDFSWDFPYERVVMRSRGFPVELLRLCANNDIGLEVSVYPSRELGDEEPNRDFAARFNALILKRQISQTTWN